MCHLSSEEDPFPVGRAGLAPFRGFIQERSVGKREEKVLGSTVLYFGCRHKSEDYIYQEELEACEEDGTISDLFVAFSRDQVCVCVCIVLANEWEILCHVIGNVPSRDS